jgi:ADP-heptose:LPS heptosyltransferase
MALRRNILVFHQGALGDFVVTWPLALGLARAFAQSRIFYMTAGQKGALAEKALRTESVDVESGWHQLYSDQPQLPERPRKLLEGAQLIVSFVNGPSDAWEKNVRAIAPEAGLITLSTVLPANFPSHVTDHLLAQLKPFPVVEAAMGQMLKSIAARGLGASRPAGGPVVLHPGAGSGKKCWPPEFFLQLAERLRESGRSVEVILGDVEREKWPADQLKRFADIARVSQPDTLVDLMGHLSNASTFVGNDSGPGHLAAILGVPTVSIFGPKDPANWHPLGPAVCTLTGDWQEIDVERVTSAVFAV